MRIKYILALLPLLTLLGCDDEDGHGIGRARRDVALEKNALCSHYLSAVKPAMGGAGYVILAPNSAVKAAAAENYTLCQFGSCQEVTTQDGEVTINLPLNGLDPAESGELALALDGDFQNPAKICSYIYWQKAIDGSSDAASDAPGPDSNSDAASDTPGPSDSAPTSPPVGSA